MRLTGWVACFAIATVLLTSACGFHACVGSGCSAKIDTAKVERETKAFIAKQTGSNVASVTCPKDVKEEAGATFTCTAVGADGTRAAILITQKDDEGTVDISASLFHTGTAAKRIAMRLSRHFKSPVKVRCPDLHTVHKGTMLTCTAFDTEGTARSVAVTATDEEGSIDFRLG